MDVNKVHIIVPDLPPNINGVGDYGYILGSQLSKVNNYLNVEFIVLGNHDFAATLIDGFVTHVLKKHDSESLANLLFEIKCKYLHLHYVGYAYDKRGIPKYKSRQRGQRDQRNTS